MEMQNIKFKIQNKGIPYFLIFLFAFLILDFCDVYAEDYSDVIEKGIALYENGDFDKAIGEFKQVISELKDRPEDDARNEGLFTANLYLGMSYLGKGKESLAKESFKNAFRAAPQKTLSPEQYPPKVISLYNEVVSQSLSILTVKSNLPDAEVFVDDIKKGNAPIVIRNLLPGMHTVKVIASGQEFVKTVSLEPGRDTSIAADFQNTGSMSVMSEPPSASVYLDGKVIGATPLLIKEVPVGEHLLGISKAGYVESNQKVIVRGNEVTDVNIRLNPMTYSVSLSSVPENAEVFWDETAKGTTPVIIENVTTGLHKVRIVKEGYEEQGDAIDVKMPLTEKTYRLNPCTGSLNIKTDPAGVEVIIDNRNIGTTPMSVSALPVKQYLVKLRKEGYKEKDITVIIAKDKASEINEMLLEIDTQKPEIIFEPPAKAIKENKNFIRARIMDNQAVGDVLLMLKMEGEMNFQGIRMSSPLKGIYEAVIPDLYLKKGAVLEYYIAACDLQNNCEASGSKESAYQLKVISLEPYTEGFVLDIDSGKDNVTISLGSVDGVKKEDRYVVFRAGKELRNPKTGELLQIEEVFVGTIKVRELMPRTAYATIEDDVIPVAKNDRIRKQASAPAGVVTEGNYATKVMLRWAPNREPEVKGYRIFRSSKIDGNYQKIGEVDERDNTLYEDTDDMMEGLTFYYKIAAFNIFETNGIMSEPVAGKTKKGVLPPGDIKADGTYIREVHLRWDISKQDPDIERYIIYKADAEGGQFVEIAQAGRDADSYTDMENLKDGKTYYYKIAGKSRHGSIGEPSKAVITKTKEGPPPPQKIRAVSGVVKMAKVQWDRHADADVAGYVVYRNDKEYGNFAEIGRTWKTEFLDKDLSDGRTYYYIVSSFYSIRGMEIMGPLSNPVSAETKHRPKAPIDVSAESGLARKVNLKWNKNEEKDIAEYWIYRGTEGGLDSSPFTKIKADINTFTDTDLKDNMKYSYAVKAVDVDGLESDLSNTVSAVTKPLPRSPTGLKGRAGQGKASLKWETNKEADIKAYNVYKKGWLKSTLLITSKENSCEIKLEDKAKSIRLYVTAVDKDELESEPSEEIEIATQ